MQFDWWTFALQTINFLVLVWLLRRFLYRPVKDVIEKRKQLAEQAFVDADKKQLVAEAAQRQSEQEKQALAKEREQLLRTTHKALETERDEVLAGARREAAEIIGDARAAVNEDREHALKDLRQEVSELAAALAGQMLRQVSTKDLSEAFLSRLEGELKALSAEEIDRLKRDLAKASASLTVATAIPLTNSERKHWNSRIDTCLKIKTKPKFVSDPELVGGVELRFPHSVLKLSWADQLQKAKETIASE